MVDARKKAKTAKRIPLGKVPRYASHRGGARAAAVRSARRLRAVARIKRAVDVQSILKLCPMPEAETLSIFSQLLDRQVIELG